MFRPHSPRLANGLSAKSWPVIVIALSVIAVSAIYLTAAGSASAPASESKGQTGSASNPPAAVQEPLTQIESGTGWALSIASDFRAAESVAVLNWDSNEPRLLWFDEGDGSVVGELKTSASAVALYRHSGNQLLVSDSTKIRPDDPVPDQGTRLLVFDEGNAGLTLRTEIALPNRARYPVYGLPVILSHDESRLVYIRYDFAPNGEACRELPGQACDYFALVEIDPTVYELGRSVSLPVGCHPAVYPYGESGFAAICKDNTAVLFDGDLNQIGEVSFSAIAPPGRDSIGNSFAVPLAYVSSRGGDTLGGLFHDGTFLAGSGANTTETQALPDSTWVAGRITQLDSERIAIPYKANMRSGGSDGLVVFNVVTLEIERDLALPGTTFVEVDTEGGVLRLVNGTLSHVDLKTGSETNLATTSEGEVIVD